MKWLLLNKVRKIYCQHLTYSHKELLVLDKICSLSDILFYLNYKSCTTNWKGYINILSKHFSCLKEVVNMKTPIQMLISELIENLENVSKQVR